MNKQKNDIRPYIFYEDDGEILNALDYNAIGHPRNDDEYFDNLIILSKSFDRPLNYLNEVHLVWLRKEEYAKKLAEMMHCNYKLAKTIDEIVDTNGWFF